MALDRPEHGYPAFKVNHFRASNVQRGTAQGYAVFIPSLCPGLRHVDSGDEADVLTRFIRGDALSEGNLVAGGFSHTECIRQDSGFVEGGITIGETYSPLWSCRVR